MGDPIYVIDPYYLTITLIISIGLQYGAFVVAFLLQFDKITDFMGGLNFFVIALLTLGLSHTHDARQIITSLMAMIWAFRLGGFLLFRVLQTGSDTRFDEMRSKIFSYLGFWTFQFLWCWTVSLPVTIGNSPRVVTGGDPSYGSATDILGLIFWIIGFTLETTADFQKYFFKSSKPPPGAIPPGVWRITRHPNYFGEILLWWGIWLSVLQPARDNVVSSGARAALYASVVGPIFITVLLFTLSGFPTAEKPAQQKMYLLSHGPDAKDEQAWPRYKRYMDSTSIFWPIPPAIYRPLPRFVKTWILLDLPFYHFDEHRDGPKAIEEAEKKKKDREQHQDA